MKKQVATRENKLLKLAQLLDPATGVIIQNKFKREQALFKKARQKRLLDKQIRNCKKCPGLNESGVSTGAAGWGNLSAKIFFIGQSLCTQCMATSIPFTAGSGYLIDAALRLSNLERNDIFISNVVHCHPPNNRASHTYEIEFCIEYLKQELNIIKPKLVVALGKDAGVSIHKFKLTRGHKFELYEVKHPASFMYSGWRGAKDWILNLSFTIDKYI